MAKLTILILFSRTDIKEDEVKEIYNRCEEHKRLWNETEIIFNSNYAPGEVST